MKVLLVTPLYPPQIGGPATYAKLLHAELPKRDVLIEIIKFSDFAHLPAGIRHLVLFVNIIKCARHVDVVFAQDVCSVGFPAVLAARILRKPCVIRVPGDFAWEQARQRFGITDSIDQFQSRKYGLYIELYRWIQRFVVHSASRVITPSEYFSKIVSGWAKKNTPITIYNGIDIDRILSFAKKTYSKNTKFSVISAGRLVPWKGFDELIRLVATEQSLRLTIVGDGPQHNALISLSRQLGVVDRVFFVSAVSQDRLFEIISQHDVFILNSSFESFSFQVVEAMALGVPVIATNGCNLGEIITNNESGILVPVGNKNALARAVVQLRTDPALYDRLRHNGQVQSQYFSMQKMLDRLVCVLEDVVHVQDSIIFLGADRGVFDTNSRVFQRLIQYDCLARSVVFIIPTLRDKKFQIIHKGAISFVPTRSFFRFFYPFDLFFLTLKHSRMARVISPQDPGILGLIALGVAKLSGTKLYVQLHTDLFSKWYSSCLFAKIEQFIANFVIRNADKVRVVSQKIKLSLANKTVAPIEVLPIMMEGFVEPKSNTTPVKRQIFTFITVSRLESEKNVIGIIRAFSVIHTKYPNTRLIIVGDGSLRKKLEYSAKKLAPDSSISFIGWQNNPIECMAIADVFVQNSWYEGYGLSLFEAMLCGLPVITTDVGIAADLIVSGKNGILFPVGDPDSLIVAMEKMVVPGVLGMMRSYIKQNRILPPYAHKKQYLSALIDFYA